ncbi:MAG TPA: xanthine dehydrogenase family protein molybdopterin-binding subunit [Anaerolineaceae bacterium]|nr:xanthine dehydrogenase family protein molybdopterin-binding subunit [Anaerolineaceae bacterium]
MKFKYLGKSYNRPDAINKVTGKAVYLDDLRIPGMLHAAILRPEFAHAEILNIDTSEAETMPGVVKVVTGKDCHYHYGDNIKDLVPMAVDKVRYIGEPVAAAIADTLPHAQAAIEKIKVSYKPLPVYVDARDAMKKDAVLIHKENGEYWHLPTIKATPGTNIAHTYHLKKGAGVDGFKDAEVIIEAEFNYPHGSCTAIEPHGSIVWFKEDNTIEVWSSSICPFIIREDLAHSYGLPVSDVRVRIPDIGGCFGYKSDITVEQTVAWIASFVPGYPVKWVATRQEDFTSTLIAHGIRSRIKVGARKDGKLVAIQNEVIHSGGAYADTAVNITIAATHNCTGPYEFENCDLTGYTVYTNTPAVGAYRGYGHQEAQIAIERMMDLLARKLNMDPIRLREMNYLTEGKVNALGERMWKSHGDILTCSNIVKEKVFTKAKPQEDENYYYGRGFAAAMKSPKGAPFSTKGCYMKMNIDGSVSVSMGGAEVGQGLRTVVRQVAAEALMIPPEKIRVYNEIDTQYSPYEWQTIGSMFTTQGGRAIIRAANRLIAVLKNNAAQVLKTDVDYLEYDGEYVYLRNDPDIRVAVADLSRGYITLDGITIGEYAHAVSDARLPRYANPDENGQGSLGVNYTFGATAAEIRIEKKTGKIIVDKFTSVFDVGQVINPRQIRGSVLGGVTMAVGAALYEKLDIDAEGRINNPHMFKYHIPTYKEAIPMDIEFIETPDAVGPFGARGIGEHSVIGPAPAILNAIYDAVGVDFYEIPVTPDVMKKALEARQEN